MLVAFTKPLFAWDCLEDSPSLGTIKTFLATLPDDQLLGGLRRARGRGRNDYPLHVLWGVVPLTVILRHPNWEACLADLRRNEALRRLIEMRSLWKEEPLRLLPGHDGNSNIVYDEKGTLYCYDRTSDPIVLHPMAYNGYEEERGTRKYRCPARHEGWTCPHDAVCNESKEYGLTVRVKCDIDLRRFPSIPRATKKFERLYDGRTAVERVNGRLKVFWGADHGNISGARRFRAFVGVVMKQKTQRRQNQTRSLPPTHLPPSFPADTPRSSVLFCRLTLARPALFADLRPRRVLLRSDPIGSPPCRAVTTGNRRSTTQLARPGCVPRPSSGSIGSSSRRDTAWSRRRPKRCAATPLWPGPTSTILQRTRQVCGTARRRVLCGETVPNREKLFSLFEPHTPLYKRGKIVEHPCLPMSGAHPAQEQEQSASVEFRAARRSHPGVESAIGALQSGNGLRRCRDRTERGFARHIGLGVLGRNLHVLGKLLIARQSPDCQAAHSRRRTAA